MAHDAGVLLEVDDFSLDYYTGGASLPVLRNVSFTVGVGEIVGIVGESGCGKSTLGSAVMRQLPSNARYQGGSISFDGIPMASVPPRELQRMRGTDVAMIFQDPLTSLNPTFTVWDQMRTVYQAHQSRHHSRREIRDIARTALEDVGVRYAEQRLKQYPHELSGGLRQRVMIAMALMLRVRLLVADEPTSALDVTLQAQIIGLLAQIREEHDTSMLFISHDLPLVSRLCDRVLVIYAGKVVESGPTAQVIHQPLHPYTRALLAASPTRRMRGGRLGTISGRVPSPLQLPTGCPFHDRCEEVLPQCADVPPDQYTVNDHTVFCHARTLGLGFGPHASAPEEET